MVEPPDELLDSMGDKCLGGFCYHELDVLDIDVAWLNFYGPFDFICASSPCEQFSTMRNFRPPVLYPELGVKLFKHTRDLCEASGVPYVMENVSGAGRYVGKAVAHCGSYYLWGTAVPTILPQNIRKGMTQLAMGCREKKGRPGWNDRNGKRGQTPTELVATIPPELANCAATYAERLLEQKNEVGETLPRKPEQSA